MADEPLDREAMADANAALNSMGDDVIKPGCAIIVGGSSWLVLRGYEETVHEVYDEGHDEIELSLLVSHEDGWICRTTLRTRLIDGVQEIRDSQWADYVAQKKGRKHMQDLGGSGLMVVPGI